MLKNDKRDITIIDREYRKIKSKPNKKGKIYIEKRKFYKYKCNKCGYDEGWAKESDLLKGNGCSCCNGKIVVYGINSIYDTTPWMVKCFINPEDAKLYASQSNDKIKVKCPYCGRIKNKKIQINSIYKQHSIGCSYCGDGISYGHKYMFNLFTQINQKFIDNYTFDWCKFYNHYKNKEVSGEYDFVLGQNKLIIEVDGGFHRKDNTMSGQTKEESRFIDDEKDRLAQEQGYKMIRISDECDFKQNILDSDLSKIFDLFNIDWLKCEEFALSSRVKEACNLKKNSPRMSTVEIGKIMNLSHNTIITYLKKGSKLSWCEYNPKEERKKGLDIGLKMARKINSKPIKMFKDGYFLGEFPSSAYLERKSEELFGVKLLNSNVLNVCSGKYKTYKGFTFRYIEGNKNII